jgi:hypothetical protein
MKNGFLIPLGLSLIFLSVSVDLCHGQTSFEKIYATDHYDVAHSLEITADHGFILVGVSGVTFDTCITDMIVTKCDEQGNIEWSNLYSMPSCEQGYDIKQTADHGYVLAGAKVDFDGNKMVLMKVDSIGQIEWQKLYSSNDHDEISQLFPLPDGGFLMAGYRYNFSSFGYDVTFARVNSTGDVTWSKAYLTTGAEYGLIQIYDNGDDTYFLTCTNFETTFPANENFYLLHVDSSGNVISSRQYGGSDTNEKGWGIIKISPDKYWMIGHSGENGDALLFQIDNSGAVLWAKRYNDGTYNVDESSMTSFLYVAELGLYICGFDGFYNPYSFLLDKGDAFLFQVDDNGNVLWWRDYGDPQPWYWEAFFRMRLAKDGSLLMAGGRTTNGNYDDQEGWDMYVVKTNHKGESGCEINMNVNVSDTDVPMADYGVVASNLELQETEANFIVSPAATVTILCATFPTGNPSVSDEKGIYLYPNPADEQIAIKSSSLLSSSIIRFYNVLGKEVFYSDKLSAPVNISAVPTGIYLYTIADEEGSIRSRGKIYVEHRNH